VPHLPLYAFAVQTSANHFCTSSTATCYAPVSSPYLYLYSEDNCVCISCSLMLFRPSQPWRLALQKTSSRTLRPVPLSTLNTPWTKPLHQPVCGTVSVQTFLSLQSVRKYSGDRTKDVSTFSYHSLPPSQTRPSVIVLNAPGTTVPIHICESFTTAS